MKRFWLTLTFVIILFSASAQQKGKVSFNLLNADTKQGVMGAVVEVYPTSKPNSKKYYTSGAAGLVSFYADYGEYTLSASFLGFDDAVKTFKVAKEQVYLGDVLIAESATKIETVVKEVQQFRTSQNADTLSYNAGAFKVSNDADVEGLLKKMPGITINNGSVEAQGETVQKIFVDGKEFFGEDVSTAIKSLPAEAVDRVEVFNKLSDQAEFSGMDDGEGYKAINIVTKPNMRQGQFGKVYAGIGYQPNIDDSSFNPKYTVGGNVNMFQKDSRVSVIALFNNINQQNFSFEDILGVNGSQGGGRGGRGGGVGQYMVRPQDGVALVNSIGLNYSDQWGRKKNVKFQGSYFFNTTKTKNYSNTWRWYESPSPYGTKMTEGYSDTKNGNHRFNARLDWKISRNQSLMSRTNVSYQSYDPLTQTQGYTNADTELLDEEEKAQASFMGISFIQDIKKRTNWGLYANEFLQYRVKLGKPGRTLTVDGRFHYNSNRNSRNLTSNNASAIPFRNPNYQSLYEKYFGLGCNWKDMEYDSLLFNPEYQYINTPSDSYSVRGSFQYNEPLSTTTSLAFTYRMNFNSQEKDQKAFYTDKDSPESRRENPNMTMNHTSGYWTHRVGPGFRYAKDKNSFVANVYYQRSSLDGSVKGTSLENINRTYNDVTYFGMANIAFNSENSLRLFFRSGTDAPSITQLQSIFDVSTPQYLSVGNRNLNPSFEHRIYFHYVRSNVEKGRTFMWMGSMTHESNYISQSTLYNSNGWALPEGQFAGIDIPKDAAGNSFRPTEITSYENMEGYWALRTHVSLGLPVTFLKCNLNIKAGVKYTITPTAIYKLGASEQDILKSIENHDFYTNKAKTIGYDAGITLGSNISEDIDFTLSWNGTYNQSWNQVDKEANMKSTKNNYFDHTASGSLKWVFWKGFTITTSVAYSQYVGFTQSYNEDYVLWNIYLGKKVFRNKRGEVQIGVNDVLNQNKGFSRSAGSGYTQNLTNSVVGRYFCIQFVYNLRHFGKRGTKDMSSYNYKESKSSVGMGNANTGNKYYYRR
ncbi:MAG: outer membrane beta-barrel protein [Alistipes sp.]|nr:outer membrane beta-barrel protein [Candidatus Alistipes equi]